MVNQVNGASDPSEYGLPPGWPPEFRPPTYSSATYPRFPQELIDRLCELLLYEPHTLTKCRFVCNAWYHSARRVSWGEILPLKTREALDDCARMLVSKDNQSYCRKFYALVIADNPRRPFAHIWPMLIPGCFLPKLQQLYLQTCDWAGTKPHGMFFDLLSSYTSVTDLRLWRCRFCSVAELRRILNALPGLKDLMLCDIMLQHLHMPDLVPDYVPSSRNKLEKVVLQISYPSSDDDNRSDMTVPRDLLDVCATHPTVVDLDIDLLYCSSLLHLHRSLCHFPNLSRLLVRGEFSSHGNPVSAEDMALYAAYSLTHSLLAFQLVYVPAMSWASPLLKLVSTPRACSQLETLEFSILPEGGRFAVLVPRITEVLRVTGAKLKTFTWNCLIDDASIHDVIPRLTANTSLTELSMGFFCTLSLLGVQRVLGSLLSGIQSPHLESLVISFNILVHSKASEDRNKASLTQTDPVDSISTFHAILSRPVFERPSNSGRISIYFRTDKSQEGFAMLSAMKPHINTLFAPWLDRGAVELHFLPNADGVYSSYTVLR